VVLSEISIALKSFKTAAEITKSILNISKDADLKDKIIELRNLILSLQSEYSTLLDVKDQLEKKLMEYEDWDKTESQYQLKEITPGIRVYSPKEDSGLSDSDHWLCPNCFNDRKKSILQLDEDNDVFGQYYICPKCKNRFCSRPPKPDTGGQEKPYLL